MAGESELNFLMVHRDSFPIIINMDSRKACQIILDNDDFPVKYLIYDRLKALKDGKDGE